MTIENSTRYGIKWPYSCVEHVIDCCLGSDLAGPNVPLDMYEKAREGRDFSSLEEKLRKIGGKIIEKKPLPFWYDGIDIGRQRLGRLGDYLYQDEINFIWELARGSDNDREVKMFVFLQAIARVAVAKEHNLVLRIYKRDENVAHVKFAILGFDGLAVVYDGYWIQGTPKYTGVSLINPKTFDLPVDICKNLIQSEALLAYPYNFTQVEKTEVIFLDVDPNSKMLERPGDRLR